MVYEARFPVRSHVDPFLKEIRRKPSSDISELKDKIIEKLIKANKDSNLGEHMHYAASDKEFQRSSSIICI